jgi:hypothetical protein
MTLEMVPTTKLYPLIIFLIHMTHVLPSKNWLNALLFVTYLQNCCTKTALAKGNGTLLRTWT